MIRRASSFDMLLIRESILLGLMLVGPVLTIPLHIPINYNEGWNTGFDTRAVVPNTGRLYPGRDSLVFNNYPPLGFFLVSAAGRFLFGDMIVAERVIALVALLASAAFLTQCVRQLGGTLRAALAAALLLLLFMTTFYRDYVAMDDPQWLAHAIMLGSLTLLTLPSAMARLRAGRARYGQITLAAVLMVTGGFVKHTLVALPFATALWLLWLRPQARPRLDPGCDACRGGRTCSHGCSVRPGRLHRHLSAPPHRPSASADTRDQPPRSSSPGGSLAVAASRRIAGDGAILVALFGTIALVTGTLQRSGGGVYYNAHFETMIAVCLGVGLGPVST